METFSRGTLEPGWVTGFADGEATFTYSRSGKQLALYFALKLPAQDRPLLASIQEFFGCGRIYEVRAARPASYLRMTHRADLLRVVDHFDAFPLRSSKRAVYELWRTMVLLKQGFRNPDRERLESLAQQVTALRTAD